MNTKPASITLSVCLGLFVMHAAQSAGTVDPGKLPTADQLQQWHVEKAGLGPTFSGGPAWQAHMQFVEAALRDRGVVDITKEPITRAQAVSARR
jgi:hypothetical protein